MMRQIFGWTGWATVALFALLAPPTAAQSTTTRDTTIYSATRIRSTLAGKIVSITVTRFDRLPQDTVRVAAPRDSIAFYPRVVPNPWHFTFDVVNWTGAGTKPADVAFPSLPQPAVVHDTVTVVKVRVDTVSVGTGLGPAYPYFWWTPNVRYDTVFFHLDSSRTRPLPLQSPPQKVILMRDVPGTAELPRTYLDTKMPPPMSMAPTVEIPLPRTKRQQKTRVVTGIGVAVAALLGGGGLLVFRT